MENFKIIGTIIGLILIAIGVISVYDARKLSAKWFSFFDKNSGAKWFKFGGFLISIIGVLIILLK